MKCPLLECTEQADTVTVVSSMPPVTLEPGYRLDRYELLCKIGQGGMASVWLARVEQKLGIERHVAIKTVLPEHASDAGFRTMLLDEARIASALDHPNIARILDVGEDRGVPYMVLEYVAGESLNRLHRTLNERGERIAPAIALRVLADACAGLQLAHELVGHDGQRLDIVHRDISPQNILVNEHGIVKLIDFGVAKAAGRLSGETATGIIKGKVPYMAPEQALGVPVDKRADIWSMGAVAYYLVSGRYPFDAANDAARVIRAVSGETPDPLDPSVPPAISEVIFHCLARDPAGRFSTAAELREALEGAMRRTGMYASSDDVARYFAANLVDATRARKKMLDKSLSAAGDRAKARVMLDFQAPPDRSSDARRPAISLDDETSVGTLGRGMAVPPPVPSRSKAWIVIPIALALVVAAFTIGSLTARDRSKPVAPRRRCSASRDGGARDAEGRPRPGAARLDRGRRSDRAVRVRPERREALATFWSGHDTEKAAAHHERSADDETRRDDLLSS